MIGPNFYPVRLCFGCDMRQKGECRHPTVRGGTGKMLRSLEDVTPTQSWCTVLKNTGAGNDVQVVSKAVRKERCHV